MAPGAERGLSFLPSSISWCPLSFPRRKSHRAYTVSPGPTEKVRKVPSAIHGASVPLFGYTPWVFLFLPSFMLHADPLFSLR